MEKPDACVLDVSVVAYQSAGDMQRLVSSLAAQRADLGVVALLVYDNAGTDGSLDAFERAIAPHRARFARVWTGRGERNLGFGRGQNEAIAHGRAPFVLVLNPDVELLPDCLEALLGEARSDAPDVAAWEARQVPFDHPKVYDPVTRETSWVSGTAVLLRRAAFEAVGGFDPRIFLYGEDVDLSWRMQDRGYRLRHVPRAVVRHFTYRKPRELKPAQYLGSMLAQLAIRTRFGLRRDIAWGLAFYGLHAVLPAQFPGKRRGLFRGLARFARDATHFRRGSSRTIRRRFYGEYYSPRREGAFHRVVPAADLPRLPRVSVLVRRRGCEALHDAALATVRNQTYPNLDVVEEDAGPGRGLAAAGNAALERAAGEYAIFLDEGCLFFADHIEQLVARALRTGRRVAYALTLDRPTRFAADTGAVLAERDDRPGPVRRFPVHDPAGLDRLPAAAVLFERDLARECGGLDAAREPNQDGDLWERLSRVSWPFAFVGRTGAICRVPTGRAAGSSAEQLNSAPEKEQRRSENAWTSSLNRLVSALR